MIEGFCFTNLDERKQTKWPDQFVGMPRVGEQVQGIGPGDKMPVLRIVSITHYQKPNGMPGLRVELHRGRPPMDMVWEMRFEVRLPGRETVIVESAHAGFTGFRECLQSVAQTFGIPMHAPIPRGFNMARIPSVELAP